MLHACVNNLKLSYQAVLYLIFDHIGEWGVEAVLLLLTLKT